MNSEQFEQLEDYLYDIEAVVITTCDSCEFNMYTTQELALKIVKRYLNDVFRLLDKWKS